MNLKSVFALVLLTIVTSSSVVYFLMREGTEDNADDTICLNYSNERIPKLQKGFIDGMKKNYFDNQLGKLNSLNTENKTNLEGGDTQSLRFDLEKLKNFIYHVEKNAKKYKIDSKNLGIRMHYIAYPNNDNWNKYEDLSGFDKEEKYRSRMSLILIPTNKVKNNEGKYVDVDFNLLTNKKLDLTPYNPASNNLRMNRTNQVIDKQDVLAENHAGAIPPYSIQ